MCNPSLSRDRFPEELTRREIISDGAATFCLVGFIVLIIIPAIA